jgi:transposase-like protein
MDDLESLLKGTIHCNDCQNPAEFVSSAHHCAADEVGPFFKCHSCYVTWLNRVSATMVAANADILQCTRCMQLFDTIESFSDWRPF